MASPCGIDDSLLKQSIGFRVQQMPNAIGTVKMVVEFILIKFGYCQFASHTTGSIASTENKFVKRTKSHPDENRKKPNDSICVEAKTADVLE